MIGDHHAGVYNAQMATHDPEIFPLADYLDRLVDALRDLAFPALEAFDADAIHDARVATRRLKAALDLLRPVLVAAHRQAFAGVLRKLRRRLGPLRDLDVMLDHLKELAQAGRGRHVVAVAWLTRQWQESRLAAQAKSNGLASPSRVLVRLGAWWAARHDIRQSATAVDVLLAESLRNQTENFASQANRLAGRTALPADAAVQDPHQVRIAAKALRYTLELAVEQGHPPAKSVAKSFKRLQDCLGLWHDYVILAERAMATSLSAQLAHHDSSMQKRILDLAGYALRQADLNIERFGRLWSECGAEVTASIRQVFPEAGQGALAPGELGISSNASAVIPVAGE